MSKNVFEGFISSFVFGIGTLLSPIIPIGALSGLISQQAKGSSAVFKAVRIISGLILLLFGFQLII
ncbi:MAG: hypothetical protein V2A57_03910 [Elusimicrobiota bacterium]|nr:hypothetical protein [Elusimicrobiota bacterium]